jgi:hypothetical protein
MADIVGKEGSYGEYDEIILVYTLYIFNIKQKRRIVG